MKVEYKKTIKQGDVINYYPQDMPEDGIHLNVTVTKSVEAGRIFNQPMLIIEELPHWIPAWECELADTNNRK